MDSQFLPTPEALLVIMAWLGQGTAPSPSARRLRPSWARGEAALRSRGRRSGRAVWWTRRWIRCGRGGASGWPGARGRGPADRRCERPNPGSVLCIFVWGSRVGCWNCWVWGLSDPSLSGLCTMCSWALQGAGGAEEGNRHALHVQRLRTLAAVRVRCSAAANQ